MFPEADVPFFSYKARNARGELLQGVLEGADSGAVADQLFNTGATPVEILLTKKPITSGDQNWWQRLTEEKVRAIDLQLFSRQLHTLLKAGVPIMRGLAGLQESATNKGFARILKDLRESLDSGRELSAAMHRHPRSVLRLLHQHGAGRRNHRPARSNLPAPVRSS